MDGRPGKNCAIVSAVMGGGGGFQGAGNIFLINKHPKIAVHVLQQENCFRIPNQITSEYIRVEQSLHSGIMLNAAARK